uniref:Uncharacterized protein n=1 Tax=Anguilla anguilla TaxID=7936 RepID=A0A0E9X4L7_ANGAN
MFSGQFRFSQLAIKDRESSLKFKEVLLCTLQAFLLLLSQLTLQVFDLRLQQLNHLLIVLLGAVCLPLHRLCNLQLAPQSLILHHCGCGFLTHARERGERCQ